MWGEAEEWMGFEGTTDWGGSWLKCFSLLGPHPSPLHLGQLTGRSHMLGLSGGGVWKGLPIFGGMVPVFPHLLKSGWGPECQTGGGGRGSKGHFLSGRL